MAATIFHPDLSESEGHLSGITIDNQPPGGTEQLAATIEATESHPCLSSSERAHGSITTDSHPAPGRQLLFQNMLFLEVFAGTSSLTIAVRKTDLRGVAVDKTTEPAKGPIAILDLTSIEDVEFLE